MVVVVLLHLLLSLQKKKKKFAGVKGLVSVSGAMHRNVLNFFFFTYKQTAVVICAIKHAIERAK